MAEPVEWQTDGTPFSPRFQDRYRSEDGGLSQARDVFVAGCGLPQAWRGADRWCVLETGFGLGLNFLATWQAWRDDAERPRLLHYLATEAFPASAADVRRNADVDPAFAALASELAAAWGGLEPGTNRLALEGGRVLLTLLVGDSALQLRGLGRWADCVYLDGFSPDRNPGMWNGDLLRAVARCCRPGARLATWTVARTVRDGLASAGFTVEKVEGVPPKRHNLQARLVHLPARHVDRPRPPPGDCVIVGAGLAGAAVARGMVQRGWRVTVLEAGAGPASGASGVPAGLYAPHVSKDDAVLSRLSRAGVRALRSAAGALLVRGLDWEVSGVLEHRVGDTAGDDAGAQLLPQPHAAGLAASQDALFWHEDAGWLRPDRLVAALLAQPGVTLRCGQTVQSMVRAPNGRWFLLGADGTRLAEADRVIVAAGHATDRLFGDPPALKPVAGQVSFGPAPQPAPTTSPPFPLFPPFPLNGHGHFLPSVPDGPQAAFWLAGASFERDSQAVNIGASERRAHRQANLERIGELLPSLAPWAASAVSVSDWRGVRATSPDRLPIVGPWPPQDDGAAWLCTALGARGITFALLCAELLVARMHAEPLPIAPRLAEAVFSERIWRRLHR